MDWIKNLKITQKILAFVSLVAIFIAIVGFIGYHFTTKAASAMNTMYGDRLLPISFLSSSRGEVWKIKCDILDAAIDKEEREMRTKEIQTAQNKTNELFAKYTASKLDPFEVKTSKVLKENLDKLNIAVPEIVAALKDNNVDLTYKLFFENEKLMDEVKVHFTELVDYNTKMADQINTQNDKDTATSTMLIIITIISAMIASIATGLWLARMISAPINVVVENLNEVAKGNLAVDEIYNDSTDETGILSRALNTTVKNLRELIGSVTKSIEEISAGSQEMSASADQTAQGAQQTANSTAQLAKGAQEMSLNVENGANNINQLNKVIQQISLDALEISDLGNETEENANVGNEHVKKAVNKIDSIKNVSGDISLTISELGKLSSDIEQIVDLIKRIAGQTNLLALNAAIEAARAGEHGKGFAVVAEEVKKLATQSAEATDNITAMIKEIQAKTRIAVATMNKATTEVEEGVHVVNDAGKALENIIFQVKVANNKIQGVTKSIEGVAKNSEDVLRMMENISAVTEETAASSEEISSITEEQTASLQEISAGSQTLAKVAESLNKQVSVFKI